MRRTDPEDVGRHDEGHERAGERGDPARFPARHQPDGDRGQRAGGEHLVAPGKVVPELVESFGALVRPPEQPGDDGDQRQTEQDPVADRFLVDADDFGEAEPHAAHRGVAGGDRENDDADDGDRADAATEEMGGDFGEDIGRILRHHLREKIVDRQSGGGPDHADDSLDHHHAVEARPRLLLMLHGTRDDRRLGGVEAREDAAGDGDEEHRQDRHVVFGGEHRGLEGGALLQQGGIIDRLVHQHAEDRQRAEDQQGAEERVDRSDDLVHSRIGYGKKIKHEERRENYNINDRKDRSSHSRLSLPAFTADV